MPKEKAAAALLQLKAKNSNESPIDDLGRKRIQRSESARIYIPEPENMARREACLKDPELFLRTYFKPIFFNPFAKHHLAMIDAIWERAWSGGDKAVAAPRGDGKTQVAISMGVVAVVATPVRFPVLIAGTLGKGRKLFKQFKSKFENSAKFPEFAGDFPELCIPVVSLRGAPQRAASQHVNGELTRITWSQELVVMPTIKCDWETNAVGGKRLVYFGLDSAIRGEGFEENRPDLAIIDDPETREVAFSPTDKHRDIEDMIDGDVAGLAGPTARLSRVVLTTIQNRRCYSYRATDRKIKPTFEGDRYPLLESWPDNKEHWDEYLSLRQKDQSEGLKDGPTATQYYVDNMEAMKAGAVLSNPYRFVSEVNANGERVELDALQSFYNRISDWGLPKVLAELQQDPEQEDEPETMRLTAGVVASRMSGFARNELPKVETPLKIVFGVDLGKYQSYWTKLCVHGNAITHILDYGVIENHGMQATTPQETVERSLINRLHEWRIDILSQCSPDLVLIDSGTYTESVYGFCKQAGFPFMPAKGQPENFKFTGADTPTSRHFEEVRAEFQKDSRGWLYHINGVYWKNQVQQRIKTATFNEVNQLNEGSLSVFSSFDNKQHLSFSHHLVSEQYEETFTTGKGLQKKWVVKNRNNHWLDSTAYALAGTSILGFRIVPRVHPIPQHPQTKPINRQPSRPQNFRQRKGGWIHGWRR
jgi:hypothetical protein